MSAISWVVAAGATAAAVAFAAADGAVLATEPERGSGAPRGVPAIRDRERAHRALAFARIVAYLAAGAAIADALLLTLASRGPRVGIAIALALAVVALGEGAGRGPGGRAGRLAGEGAGRGSGEGTGRGPGEATGTLVCGSGVSGF